MRCSWEKGICERPAQLDRWVELLDDLGPQSFRFRSLDGVIDDKRRSLAPLLGGSKYLKELQAWLASLETGADELGGRLLERYRGNKREPAMTPKPLPPDPDAPLPKWDSRS